MFMERQHNKRIYDEHHGYVGDDAFLDEQRGHPCWRGTMTMSETIAIYLLVFLVLFSFVLIIVWALSITDIAALLVNYPV